MVNNMENYWDGENWLTVKKDDDIIEYLNNGELHRKDGPASIFYNTNGYISIKEYHYNGKLHRENGPSLIHYKDDGTILDEYFYINDKRHRKDGPAVIFYKNNETILNQFFYYNGINFDPDDLPFELPIDNPEKKFLFKLKYGVINE